MAGSFFTGRVPEDPARALASQGSERIEQIQAIIDRARAKIESDEVVPEVDLQATVRPAYSWEVDHDPPPDAPATVWLGTVEDFATGEGYSVYFYATLATSEQAFRRVMARELGRELAHRATVQAAADGPPPLAAMFMSPGLQTQLERFDTRRGRRSSRSWRGTTRNTRE